MTNREKTWFDLYPGEAKQGKHFPGKLNRVADLENTLPDLRLHQGRPREDPFQKTGMEQPDFTGADAG